MIKESYIQNELMNIKLDDFNLESYSDKNYGHVVLKENLIDSSDSKLVSKDITNYIIRTKYQGKIDKISNVYVVKYRGNLIGLSFINYHPEEERDGSLLKEGIEIGLDLLDEYKNLHLDSLIEEELSKKLLSMYPNFSEIVARIEKDNLKSIKAVTNAGFVHVGDDEYHFKR